MEKADVAAGAKLAEGAVLVAAAQSDSGNRRVRLPLAQCAQQGAHHV